MAAVLSQHMRDEWMARGRKAAERACKQQQAIEATAARELERMKERVRADLKAEAEAQDAENAALARLAPEQRTEHYLRRQSQIDAKNYKRRPSGWMIAYQAIKGEELDAERREREAAEREAGLSEARERWEAKRDAITAEAVEARRAEEERHDAAMQTIGERKADQLDALGAEPTLESLQGRAVAA